MRFRYDGVGKLKALISPRGNEWLFDYDELNRPVNETDPLGHKMIWEYDPIGLITKKLLPNGVTATMTHERRRLRTMRYTNASGANLLSLAYEHDAIANITKMTDDEGVHGYSYDAQNRLTVALYPDGSGEQFTMDASGNRLERLFSRGGQLIKEQTTYDPADQIEKTEVDDVTPGPPPKPGEPPPAAFIHLETRTYGNDRNGNLSSIATTSSTGTATMTLDHDARDRMVKVTLPDGRTSENEYYPDSPLRLWFTTASSERTYQVWDETTQNLIQDLSPVSATLVDYVMGLRIDEGLAMLRLEGAFAYVGDHLRSVRQLVNASGEIVNAYRYLSYGNPRRIQEQVPQRFRFAQRELDATSQLFYYRHRHYSPAHGRFIQRDPLLSRTIRRAGVPQAYAYAGSNPIGFVDPLGLQLQPAPPRPAPAPPPPPPPPAISCWDKYHNCLKDSSDQFVRCAIDCYDKGGSLDACQQRCEPAARQRNMACFDDLDECFDGPADYGIPPGIFICWAGP